jgi:hypothetical protein
MATMTIKVTVNAKGVTWSRTASIEVDTANYQQGNNINGGVFGIEGLGTNQGTHSYSGIAVGVVANKGRGSVAQVGLYNAGDYVAGAYILPTLPFIF